MGYTRHNLIVCTFFDKERSLKCHAKAKEIFGENVTELTKPVVNGYCAFMIPPDGSKEGWEESNDGDARRKEFIEYLRVTYDEHYCDWVEVAIPEDDKAYFSNQRRED